MKQISVISTQQPDVIAELTLALAAESINITSLVSDTLEEHTVTILTVDRYDDALRILRSLPDVRAITEDAILIRLEDKPGALAQVVLRFKNAHIAMRSIRIVERSSANCLVAISTDQRDEALVLVKDLLIA